MSPEAAALVDDTVVQEVFVLSQNYDKEKHDQQMELKTILKGSKF